MCAAIAGCHQKPPAEPLKLEGNLLTVENRTKQDWNHVDIWLNRVYRVQAKSIPAGGRLEAPLNVFVAGFGQKFDFKRQQINDLRLTATLPDGAPLELKKQFEQGSLADALGGVAKKK